MSDAVTFSFAERVGTDETDDARARAFLRRFYSTLGITKLRHARLGVRPLASRPRRLSNRPAMFPATNNAARSALSRVSALTRASAPRHRFVIPAACSGFASVVDSSTGAGIPGRMHDQGHAREDMYFREEEVKALQQLVKKARAQARASEGHDVDAAEMRELKRLLGDSKLPDDILRKLVDWKHRHE